MSVVVNILMNTDPMNPINLFAFALLDELQQECPADRGSNTVVSPLSLFQTMAIAAYGAQEGKTLDGLLNVTHVDDLEKLCDISRDFSRSNADRDVLSCANAVWSSHLTESFTDDVKANLNAEVFPEAPHKDIINAWVERKTNGMIKNLLSADPPDGATLVNAVHFKDQWKTSFMKSFTREADFHTQQGGKTSMKVDMMVAASPYGDTRQKGFDYYADDKVQAAVVPYAHDDYDAVIALPAEGVSVDNFVARDFDVWCEGMQHNKEGSVSFPKFKVEYGVRDMTKVFERMGLVLDGDYSKMGPGLKVGSVFHKAVMTVDEEGTEAAAASAMMMLTAMPIDPPFHMVCDRPFLFIVRHRPTNSIVFNAKIKEPTLV